VQLADKEKNIQDILISLNISNLKFDKANLENQNLKNQIEN